MAKMIWTYSILSLFNIDKNAIYVLSLWSIIFNIYFFLIWKYAFFLYKSNS